MFVSGKRFGHPTVAAVAAGHQQNNPLLFVPDRHSGRRFLVDTGAQISVIPASIADKNSGRSGPSLMAANGTPIRTYGTRSIPLTFNAHFFRVEFHRGRCAPTAAWRRLSQIQQLTCRLASRLFGECTNICVSSMRTHLWPRPPSGCHLNQ